MDEPIDPECALASAYAPAPRREALRLLWRLDATLGRIVATTREPTLGAVRLLWWRDALAALDEGPPPAEPLLREIAAALLPAGVTGHALAAIAEGWERVLPGAGEPEALARHAAERGGGLFALAAAVLDATPNDALRRAGEGWALVDLARRGIEVSAALSLARARFAPSRRARWAVALRPLGMLATLARRDASAAAALPHQGGPGRIGRMIAHRLTGH